MTLEVRSHEAGIEEIDVVVREDDLDLTGYQLLSSQPFLAWDIETSGLDWRAEEIRTVQLATPQNEVTVVRVGSRLPCYLRQLLEAPHILKVMHHAMFDLRFMAHAWSAAPRSIACTKIAAKLLHPDDPERHSLAALSAEHCGVQLDKSLSTSDWAAVALSTEQLTYAATDVLVLPRLFTALDRALEAQGLTLLRDQCYAHLPTRVELEVKGYGDVYTY